MPLISHFTCHEMPIAGPRLRADSWEITREVIHEFTRCRDLRQDDRLEAGLEGESGEAVSVPSTAECFH